MSNKKTLAKKLCAISIDAYNKMREDDVRTNEEAFDKPGRTGKEMDQCIKLNIQIIKAKAMLGQFYHDVNLFPLDDMDKFINTFKKHGFKVERRIYGLINLITIVWNKEEKIVKFQQKEKI